jgi:hypothetical protein
VYDASGGFVTGGGWINSPPGAYYPNPALVGRANFGFVSKYEKNMTVPTGQTEFQFQTANLNFHSTAYYYMLISGPKAQYCGTGTVNGVSGYAFQLTGWDGSQPGGGGVDKFRVKILQGTENSACQAMGTVVYDNQLGAPNNNDPTTALGGGNIVIHK